MKKKSLSFEQKLQQLEHIVSDLEAGDISLETLLKKYQEGQTLLGACREELDRAEMIVKTYGETSGAINDSTSSEIAPCS
ncbi:MAG: exodeoxyribonuclease VII small subunit [Puniceicoccales bacterium]|jgi:exodeoxyribonuclease VII small subunit|nr:exodeoxyribonuclease VII small subunit [Puniceicoccales bacterium]